MSRRYMNASIAAGLFCIAALSTMLVAHAWPVWTGKTVYLRVVPVDPRDLFRGDYVTLSYTASVLHRNQAGNAGGEGVDFQGDWWQKSKRPGPMYVSLRATQADASGVVEYVPVAVSEKKTGDGLWIRGEASSSPFRNDWAPADTVYMDYGIDAFFVQEGRGLEIQDAIRSRKPVFAELAVAASGRARIRALLVNGQRYAAD